VDFRQFLGTLRNRWRFIVLTLVIGTVVTIGVTLATPTTYASRATLWITTPPSGVIDTYQGSLTAQDRAQSYANLANNQELMQRVAERLNLGLSAADLSRRVRTTVSPDTVLLEVEARAGSPELAQNIATVVSDEIIRMVKEIETPADSDIPAPIVARLAAKATLNSSPVSPNVPLNLVTGIGLSLLAGLAGALLRDVLDTSVKTIDTIEEITGLTPMAALPFDPSVSAHPLSADDAGSPLSEAFRVLRTNVRFANLDADRQTIVVTSSVPDEGKTFVATNLAVAIAKGGRSVLLLDADLRNPGVATLLGLENAVGLVTVLLGRTTLDAAVQPHESGLFFLGTGPLPPNPAEVLDTQVMRDLVAQARRMFDVVIIDAPPLLPVADAAILLTEVDGALLLARHGTTHREQLKRAVARVHAVGGKLLGTVVNRVPMGGKGGAYGYYGYGYGYGPGSAYERDTVGASRASASKGRRARR
jgi:receptor protein-tyrosine kinase